MQLLKFDTDSGELIPVGNVPSSTENFLTALRRLSDRYNAVGYTDDQVTTAFKAAVAENVQGTLEQTPSGIQWMDSYLARNFPGVRLASSSLSTGSSLSAPISIGGTTLPGWVLPVGAVAVVAAVIMLGGKKKNVRRRI